MSSSAVTAPITDLLLVSHGSPSDPEPQERFIQDLAQAVARAAGIKVRGATLAAEGALAAAVQGVQYPAVFPHFMADGWFVSTNMPRKLRAAGLTDWQALPPLGLLPALADLALARLAKKTDDPAMQVVVAAHGSPSDPRPARATEAFAERLRASGRFAAVTFGFVDEEPSLEAALDVAGPAIVVPFFAAKAGHVLMDLPEAVEAAAFTGPVLEPIGTWPEIPDLIAASLPKSGAEDAA